MTCKINKQQEHFLDRKKRFPIKSFHDPRGACCLITMDYIIAFTLLSPKGSPFAPHGHLI